MIDDSNQTLQGSGINNGAEKPAKSKVDLFPALADRKMMSINAIRQPVPAHIGTQISVFNPESFEEALDIVECLRSRAATTITLDNMRKWDASRLVDFVAGASAALDGDFHKLSDQVYLFCPSNINITATADKTMPKPKHSETQGVHSLDFLYPNSSEKERSQALSSWSSS